MSNRKGIGGHQSASAGTHVWLTPPSIIAALGPFDLDPCAAPPPRPWDTAKHHYALPDDGLALPWWGRIWCNPPYGPHSDAWLAKLGEHGRGTALIFARTETESFFKRVWKRAEALLFLEGRLHFHFPDGRRADANGGAPSVLIAYGAEDADRLHGSNIEGHFVPLTRGAVLYYLVKDEQCAMSWRQAVTAMLESLGGAASLKDLYAAFERHPKTRQNPNWRAKIRQTLARAGIGSHGPAQYSLALSA